MLFEEDQLFHKLLDEKPSPARHHPPLHRLTCSPRPSPGASQLGGRWWLAAVLMVRTAVTVSDSCWPSSVAHDASPRTWALPPRGGETRHPARTGRHAFTRLHRRDGRGSEGIFFPGYRLMDSIGRERSCRPTARNSSKRRSDTAPFTSVRRTVARKMANPSGLGVSRFDLIYTTGGAVPASSRLRTVDCSAQSHRSCASCLPRRARGVHRAMAQQGSRTVGILGAGKLGTVLARLAARPAITSSSPDRRPGQIMTAEILTPGAEPLWAKDVARRADLIIWPCHSAGTGRPSELQDKLVIDAMNYWWKPTAAARPETPLPAAASSSVICRRPPGENLNHMGYHDLEDGARPAGTPSRKASP